VELVAHLKLEATLGLLSLLLFLIWLFLRLWLWLWLLWLLLLLLLLWPSLRQLPSVGQLPQQHQSFLLPPL